MAVLTTTSQKRNSWMPWLGRCNNGTWANPTFFGKVIGGVPEPWADAILALEIALKATGYAPRSAWAYNFRGISGRACSCSNYGNCSLHSNGIAIDIDPRENPYVATRTFRWNDTAFTPEQIAAIEDVKNTKGEQLWFWGGRWTTIKDYMHFEANVDSKSTEVDWGTVPYLQTGNQIGGLEMLRPCKLGDKGEHIGALQAMLFASGFDPGKNDDSYGPKTSEALLAMRKSLKSSATSGDVFDKWAFEQLVQAHTRALIAEVGVGKQGPPGKDGRDGKDGAPGPSPKSVEFKY